MWATAADVDVGIGIDVMYCHHFVQNECVINPDRGTQTVYTLSTQSLVPGSLVGSVYLDDKHLGVFHDGMGEFCVLQNPTLEIMSVRVNCKTGKIIIQWVNKVKSGQTKVVVSYEYYKDQE